MQISDKEKKQILQTIVKTISDNQKFLLVAHTNPDGDSIGSQIALCLSLQQLGKSVVIFSEDKIPPNYHFLLGSQQILHELPSVADFDVVFILDCSDTERQGKHCRELSKAKLLINIDHHYSNKGFCPITLLDSKAGATAELVFCIIEALGTKITADIANNIYAGVLTDTGGFCYSSTTSNTLLVASKVVAAGANPQMVSENIYEDSPMAKIKLLSQALASLNTCAKGAIGWLTVTLDDIARAGAVPEHTEGLVEVPRRISGVKIAILFKEVDKNYYKISLRSKGSVNVARPAEAFGGGGHINAAACRCQGDLDAIRTAVITEVKKSL